MRPLFGTSKLAAHELRRDQIPALQALFEANSDYFLTVSGRPPDSNEAEREFEEFPPPHLSFGTRWFAGIFDASHELKGVVILVSDLVALGVWHTALFLLDRSLRGTGAAPALHASMEAMALASGANWLRLSVVDGNKSAERFWTKCGYRAVRRRDLTASIGHTRTAIVMVKSLTGGEVSEYLRLVPRDQPDSPLP